MRRHLSPTGGTGIVRLSRNENGCALPPPVTIENRIYESLTLKCARLSHFFINHSKLDHYGEFKQRVSNPRLGEIDTSTRTSPDLPHPAVEDRSRRGRGRFSLRRAPGRRRSTSNGHACCQWVGTGKHGRSSHRVFDRTTRVL